MKEYHEFVVAEITRYRNLGHTHKEIGELLTPQVKARFNLTLNPRSIEQRSRRLFPTDTNVALNKLHRTATRATELLPQLTATGRKTLKELLRLIGEVAGKPLVLEEEEATGGSRAPVSAPKVKPKKHPPLDTTPPLRPKTTKSTRSRRPPRLLEPKPRAETADEPEPVKEPTSITKEKTKRFRGRKPLDKA